jgi:hypothetical protein
MRIADGNLISFLDSVRDGIQFEAFAARQELGVGM